MLIVCNRINCYHNVELKWIRDVNEYKVLLQNLFYIIILRFVLGLTITIQFLYNIDFLNFRKAAIVSSWQKLWSIWRWWWAWFWWRIWWWWHWRHSVLRIFIQMHTSRSSCQETLHTSCVESVSVDSCSLLLPLYN